MYSLLTESAPFLSLAINFRNFLKTKSCTVRGFYHFTQLQSAGSTLARLAGYFLRTKALPPFPPPQRSTSLALLLFQVKYEHLGFVPIPRDTTSCGL